MTLDKLPGMYFTDEIVQTLSNEMEEDEVLTFVVQTSTALAIDEVLTYFENFNSFKTIANNKGLNKTLAMIELILANTEQNGFYVYSVKTDTADGWKQSVNSHIHLKENRRVIYFEENKTELEFSTKIASLKTGCNECYEYGAFKTSYVIPLATIDDAIENAENTAPETVVISTLTSILSAAGSGRLCVIIPDAYAQMVATIINAGYTMDAGFPVISGSIASLRFNFTYQQMVQLMNLGVMFVKPEKINGQYIYRINLGVTTSFKEDKSDGLLVDRLIADEVLHRIDDENSGSIKDLEGESSVSYVQAGVDKVVNEFVDAKLITKSGTTLKAFEAGNMKYGISGNIETAKTLAIIEVTASIS